MEYIFTIKEKHIVRTIDGLYWNQNSFSSDKVESLYRALRLYECLGFPQENDIWKRVYTDGETYQVENNKRKRKRISRETIGKLEKVFRTQGIWEGVPDFED